MIQKIYRICIYTFTWGCAIRLKRPYGCAAQVVLMWDTNPVFVFSFRSSIEPLCSIHLPAPILQISSRHLEHKMLVQCFEHKSNHILQGQCGFQLIWSWKTARMLLWSSDGEGCLSVGCVIGCLIFSFLNCEQSTVFWLLHNLQQCLRLKRGRFPQTSRKIHSFKL